MSRINIDYDGLSQQASALKNHMDAYESLCTRMRNMTEQVSSTWEGSAATAFTGLMQQYLQQGASITEIIGLMKGYADTTSSSFQNVDQECANLIRSSF